MSKHPSLLLMILPVALPLLALGTGHWRPFRVWDEAHARACAANQKTLAGALEMYTLDY
jgi:hypothetical protein